MGQPEQRAGGGGTPRDIPGVRLHGPEWFARARAHIYSDRNTAAGIIHRGATSVIGSLAEELKRTFPVVKSFKQSSVSDPLDSVANSVATSVIRVARAAEIGEGDLLTAMSTRVYLIRAKERVAEVRIEDQSEAARLETARITAVKDFKAFVLATFHTAEEREVAFLLGYAVKLIDGVFSGKGELTSLIANHGLAVVLPRLREQHSSLGDESEQLN